MADTCTLCPVYRPDARPRHPETLGSQTCNGHRTRFVAELGDYPRLHRAAANPDHGSPDNRRYPERDRKGDPTGRTLPADPIAVLGGAGPVPGQSAQPRVSGSHDQRLPINIDQTDLTSPARPLGPIRDNINDQTGLISVATLLDGWARSWRAELFPHTHLPDPTVRALVRWMLHPIRIDAVLDRYSALPDCAAELHDMWLTLRHFAGETPAAPRIRWGVRCQGCRAVNQLFEPTPPGPGEPRPVGDDYIECGTCGRLYTDAEYRQAVTETLPAEQQIAPPAARQLQAGR